MAPDVTIGARTALASRLPDGPREAIRATMYQYDVYADVARADDRFSGPLSWLRPLEVSSFWEQALLAVLFLLICGLVAVRIVQAAADRDLQRPVGSLLSGADGDSDETDQSADTHNSRTADHRGYERYLSPETPPELLSDEGKVVRLLVANHGRIRQHQITDETGWSKSKVSRICSQMHADGVIEKQSVGRENIITLSTTESDGDTNHDDPNHTDDVENPLP